MQSETTTAITSVKQDVRLREWAEQLEAQQLSANGKGTAHTAIPVSAE